ncbi:hypothetical protein EDE15_4598 [Edaphobacter aggregans]|uniref:Uncharacterized protein n=1 Tax=Edaphobacter aggregans TaxID=570835 RepID=A0A428MPZ7_9BACT|nr:hypothetical protein EDE15_4598 [Edaphobacter aggregans]
MRQFVRSGIMRTIFTVLSWIFVFLLVLFYFRVLMKGYFWMD